MYIYIYIERERKRYRYRYRYIGYVPGLCAPATQALGRRAATGLVLFVYAYIYIYIYIYTYIYILYTAAGGRPCIYCALDHRNAGVYENTLLTVCE